MGGRRAAGGRGTATLLLGAECGALRQGLAGGAGPIAPRPRTLLRPTPPNTYRALLPASAPPPQGLATLESDLPEAYDYVAPCFPPGYNTFDSLFQMYHVQVGGGGWQRAGSLAVTWHVLCKSHACGAEASAGLPSASKRRADRRPRPHTQKPCTGPECVPRLPLPHAQVATAIDALGQSSPALTTKSQLAIMDWVGPLAVWGGGGGGVVATTALRSCRAPSMWGGKPCVYPARPVAAVCRTERRH